MKTLKHDNLRLIGHWRGVEQFEVLDNMALLVLTLDRKNWYLSQVNDGEDYNANIIKRISNFYQVGVQALGELVNVER